MKRFIPILLLSAFTLSAVFAPGVHAVDAGAFIQSEFEAYGQDDTDMYGAVIFAPWVSVPLGESELYVSAGVHANFGDETIIAPDLFRLEFSSRIASMLTLRLGRINWLDPSGFVAKGRFDGLDVFFDSGRIRLGISGLYTGLLFKDAVEINVSPTDSADYDSAFDWGDFSNTYFAPRRAIASLYGEFPGFLADRSRLFAGIMGQFDLSDADEKFNTQYALLRHVLVYKVFDFDLAGAAELENTEAEGLRPGIAVSAEIGVQLPTPIPDRFSLGFSWASGEGPSTAPFFPITREAQSFVLEPRLSGMMILSANYMALFARTLSVELGGKYFLRNDSESFTAPYLEDDSYPLGLELGGSLQWVPLSDISFTVRGGVFLPSTGSAWADDAPVLWRVTAGLAISF